MGFAKRVPDPGPATGSDLSKAFATGLLLCGIASVGLTLLGSSRQHRGNAADASTSVSEVEASATSVEFVEGSPYTTAGVEEPLKDRLDGSFVGRADLVATGSSSSVQRIAIPRIGVNAPVEEVVLSGKEWAVPRFAVGHLAETTPCGHPGNAVFAGHLTSVSSGNVFARLGELDRGDEIEFVTPMGNQAFRVIQTRLVRNTDISVLEGSKDRFLVTLITCAGKWNPKENDYDQRRVVVAEAFNPDAIG